jgi:hypothetical protein
MSEALDAPHAEIGTVMSPNRPIDPIQQHENPKGEISHTTSNVGVMELLLRDWVYLTTITWTREMNPGTVLFSLPIHPTTCNEYVKWFAMMWNAFTGGWKMRGKIVGTAFYGGDLRFGIIQPNINPARIQELPLSFLTAMPNVAMDPKDSRYFEIGTTDQRNVLYHYNSSTPNFADPNSFCGTFVIYVVAKLVTQSDEFNNIQILLECAGDFEFSQPAPLNISPGPDPIDSVLPIWATSHLLNQPGCDDFGVVTGEQNIMVLPSSVVGLPCGAVFSRGDLGVHTSAFPGSAVSVEVAKYRDTVLTRAKTAMPICNGHFVNVETLPAIDWRYNLDSNTQTGIINCEADAMYIPNGMFGDHDPTTESLRSHEITVTDTGMVRWHFKATVAILGPPRSSRTGIAPGADSNFGPVDPTKLQTFGSTDLKPTAPGESIVVFTNRRLRTMNAQTWNISEAMKNVRIRSNTSAVFSLRPYESALPVRILRLNPNGFFTTNGSATNIIFGDDCYLQFEYMLPINSPLPPLTGDMLIHDYNYKSQTRKEMKKFAQLAELRKLKSLPIAGSKK